MRQFIILLKKDLLELYRTKKILIVGIVFILFALASPILAKITPDLLGSITEFEIEIPEATIVDSYDQLAQNFTQLGLFTIVIAFGGLIVNERKKGLYNTLLNNGVKKSNFILAKITAQIGVVLGIYLISCLLFSVYNYVLFGSFLVEYSILSFLSLFLFLIFVISIVNFFGSFIKSTILSIILSFSTAILMIVFELFRFGRYLPNHLVNISINIFKDQTSLNYAYITIINTILISLVLFGLSIMLCKNKE